MAYQIRTLPEKLSIDVLSALKNRDGSITGSEQELLERREGLAELARAFHYRDINYITLTAVHPEDMFFRACLAKVLRTLKIQYPEESFRGPAVYKAAKKIFDAQIDDFRETIKETGASDLELNTQLQKSQEFIDRIAESEKDESWNKPAYERKWPKNLYKEEWQQNIIDKFCAVSESSFHKDPDRRFVPSEGWNRRRAVSELVEFDTRYYHNLPIAYSLIDQHLADYPTDKKIEDHQLYERDGVLFTGGSGSGKSTMFRSYILGLEDRGIDAYNIVYHNTDFAVNSVWEFAQLDPHISRFLDKNHKGDQTHGSASDATFMSLELRSKDVAQNMCGPDVVAGSVEVNNDVIEDILLGGGKVEIHHISVSKEVAKASCENRPDASGRVPPDDVVERSVKSSAASLTKITNGYAGSNVTAYIYERLEKDSSAKLAAIVDCEKSEIIVNDMDAFKRSLMRSEIGSSPEDSARKMLEQMFDSGFSVISLGQDGKQLYKINSNRKVEYSEGKLGTVDTTILQLAYGKIQAGGIEINSRHSNLRERSLEAQR